MSETHTPLPWHVNQLDGYSIHGIRGWIADVTAGTMNEVSIEEREANAKFIVEACNNYERIKAQRDELLAVMKRVLAFQDQEADFRSQMRQAIANAEKEKGQA